MAVLRSVYARQLTQSGPVASPNCPARAPGVGPHIESPTGATNGPEELARPEERGDGQERGADALRAELKAVRAEAAKCRTEAGEEVRALKAARIPEQFQAVADRAAGLETELHRERLARRYHLPDALGRGGLDPSVAPAPGDPGGPAASIPRAPADGLWGLVVTCWLRGPRAPRCP
ncbi:hypothetical protein SNOUR_08520 [Streptomyces noursei ATCC 11455]|nr:hypothetical protein SNOUR_08520 [Streptomyces noursei ATCC 11455]